MRSEGADLGNHNYFAADTARIAVVAGVACNAPGTSAVYTEAAV